ncbi:uncharacterized protein G2W53_037144 [Senna tora]|uniref:Uncharacterized protein n=1 Tax=Senna tora TaxID=362788 RepID=A0A834SVA7_9FABA|nr:uncharacterized protein G2W53_037144 [Senna tora]
MSTLRELNDGVWVWKGPQGRRFRDYDKFFTAHVGRNQRGWFLCITEFFQGGREVAIMPSSEGERRWGAAPVKPLTTTFAEVVKGTEWKIGATN